MFLLFVLMISYFIECDARCLTSTLYATTSLKSYSYLYYSNNDYCTIYFRPSSGYSSGYFLEIKWTKFNIEGKMPSCSYDSVEVFLTSSYKSIGKYCSDNIGSNLPFDMYSHDGYAKIRFKSDASTTGSGFRITYRLRRKSLNYVSAVSNALCVYSGTTSSGVITSNGWPYKYGSYSSSYCYRGFLAGSSYNTRFALMDVNLQTGLSLYCSSSNDYVDIKQSSVLYSTEYSIRNYAASVGGKYCGSYTPRTLTATQKYVYLYFKHPKGFTYSKRGFAFGHLSYRVTSDSGPGSGSTRSTRSGTGSIVGGIIGAIILIVLLIILVYYCKRKHRPELVVHTVTQPSSQSGPIVVANVTNMNSQMTTNNTQQVPAQTAPPPQPYGQPPPPYYSAQQTPYPPKPQYFPQQQYPPNDPYPQQLQIQPQHPVNNP